MVAVIAVNLYSKESIAAQPAVEKHAANICLNRRNTYAVREFEKCQQHIELV
jgi:hypothetical protein